MRRDGLVSCRRLIDRPRSSYGTCRQRRRLPGGCRGRPRHSRLGRQDRRAPASAIARLTRAVFFTLRRLLVWVSNRAGDYRQQDAVLVRHGRLGLLALPMSSNAETAFQAGVQSIEDIGSFFGFAPDHHDAKTLSTSRYEFDSALDSLIDVGAPITGALIASIRSSS